MDKNFKPPKITETVVTVSSARFIGGEGWKILSMALPGGGSGIAFFPAGSNPRRGVNDSIVPDLIATNKLLDVLIFESKPRPNLADAKKLRILLGADYSRSIKSTLGFAPRRIFLGVGFGCASGKDLNIVDEMKLIVDFGIEVSSGGLISICWDQHNLFSGV